MDEKYEKFMEKHCPYGNYQKLISLMMISSCFIIPIFLLILPTMSKTPDFSFNTGLGILHITDHQLFCDTVYNTLTFDQIYDNIIINNSEITNWASELKIVCNTKQIFSIISTVYFVGSVSSNLALSKLPDMYGRKNIYIIFSVVSCLTVIQICYLRHFSQLVVSAFLLGFASMNVGVGVIIVNENFTKNKSGMIIGLMNATFPFSGMINTILLILFANWRVYYYIMSALSIFCAVAPFFYLKESPKWLLANGKVQKFKKTIIYISRMNGKIIENSDFDEIIDNYFDNYYSPKRNSSFQIHSSSSSSHSSETLELVYEELDVKTIKNTEVKSVFKKESMNVVFTNKKNYEVTDLIRYKSIRYISLFMVYLWITSGISFYGLLLNLENMTGNIYIDSFVSYTGEFIGEVSSGYLAGVLGNKSLTYSITTSCLACILFSFVENIYLKIPILFIASIGIAAAFNLLYIISPQLYPINIKSLAINTLSLTNRVGAGFVPLLINILPNSLILFIGVINTLGIFFSSFLPETRDYDAGNDIFEEIPKMRENTKLSPTKKRYSLT